MGVSEAEAARKHRLLEETQGRRLDEAYQHRRIREDMQDEASTLDPDPLVTPEMLDQLREYMGELGGAGIPAGVITAEPTVTTRALFSTDAVVIVPGFLASTLSDTRPGGYGLIWCDPRLVRSNEFGALQLGAFDGTDQDANPNVRVVASGGLPIVYDLLRLALEARRYTTAVFGVDWRRDLEISAKALRDRLREMGAARSPKPVHLIAHSQGGMVARRAIELLGEVAARRIVKNLVLLGPAMRGSFSAPLALSGAHESLTLLRRLAIEPAAGFEAIFGSMSGLYQLFPWDESVLPWLGEAKHAIGAKAFWKQPIDEARLAQFYGWARSIDADFFNDRTAVILGDNKGVRTTAGIAYGPSGSLVVTHDLKGDGTVPHCCAVIKGAKAYLAEGTEHSMLPTYRKVIAAVRAVLAGRPVGLPSVPGDPMATAHHA